MIPISIQEKIDSILPGADYPATVMKPLIQAIADAAFGSSTGILINSDRYEPTLLITTPEAGVSIVDAHYYRIGDFVLVKLNFNLSAPGDGSSVEFTIGLPIEPEVNFINEQQIVSNNNPGKYLTTNSISSLSVVGQKKVKIIFNGTEDGFNNSISIDLSYKLS